MFTCMSSFYELNVYSLLSAVAGTDLLPAAPPSESCRGAEVCRNLSGEKQHNGFMHDLFGNIIQIHSWEDYSEYTLTWFACLLKSRRVDFGEGKAARCGFEGLRRKQTHTVYKQMHKSINQ